MYSQLYNYSGSQNYAKTMRSLSKTLSKSNSNCCCNNSGLRNTHCSSCPSCPTTNTLLTLELSALLELTKQLLLFISSCQVYLTILNCQNCDVKTMTFLTCQNYDYVDLSKLSLSTYQHFDYVDAVETVKTLAVSKLSKLCRSPIQKL